MMRVSLVFMISNSSCFQFNVKFSKRTIMFQVLCSSIIPFRKVKILYDAIYGWSIDISEIFTKKITPNIKR